MRKLNEECGVFGIYDPDGHCSQSTYCGLIALQHRGQESAGIAVNHNRDISQYKGDGLVNDVFNEKILSKLEGTMAVGHVRYSTAGGNRSENAQPLVLRYIKGNLAIAHNGNVVNALELRKDYEQTGAIYQTYSDTEIIAYTIARQRIHSKSIEEAVSKSMSLLKGAYCLVVMSPQKLIAARDPWGFRPLCMGKRGNAVIFASESCALDAVDAEFVRELAPGEVVVVEDGKIHSITEHCQQKPPKLCIFEYIYFARPDSIIHSQSVDESRRLAGKYLAKEHPIEADIVSGVPDSGISAAMGFSEQSGIPYIPVFVKNRYIARTFIQPTQKMREQAVRLKLNPLKKYVEGKRIVLVDDSIVRGTTSARIINLLREAGAKEVHMRISSPPFLWPCFYGTDIPTKEELVANLYSLDETRKHIHADSLAYLGVDSLSKIVPSLDMGGYCDACFTGKYAFEHATNKEVSL